MLAQSIIEWRKCDVRVVVTPPGEHLEEVAWPLAGDAELAFEARLDREGEGR